MNFKIYIKCSFVFIFFICTSKKNAFGQADSISVILCQPWLKNAYTEFETIYPCDTTSYFGDPFGPTIQSGKKDSIHYIHIRKLIVLPPPFFTFYYESKYFTLDGIYLGDGTFDAQGNGFAGDLEENETLLYHCKDVYPDCCSTEIEMVSLTDNCGLAPRIVSTGEILRVCNIQDGLPSLPGVGRRARIGYNPVSCGPSVCNFAEKQIEITCIEPLDDAQFILLSKHVQSQDTFSIPLIVSDFKDVEAFQFPITWDTTKLELQKIYSLNDKLSNFTLASNFNQHVNGQIRCVYISFNDPISLNTKDTLLFLQFKAISEGCDSTEVKIAKSILNEDNTSFTIEVIRVIENVSVTVNVTTKDSKIDLNKTLCNLCSTAIEMVQGFECILPMVISTGEILYPCEYTNGATALPNEVGYKTNIAYIPYEGNQCFSVCLQGTGVSIGCVEKKDSCKSYAIQMVQGVECVLPKLLGTGEILYPCQFLNGAELPTTVNSLAIVNIEPFEGSGCFSTCNQGRQVTIGCALPVSDTCRSARVEMVQGVECVLPKDLYTGEILYPCEFINGATNLPNVVGEVVNINYEAFSGSGCFSTCLQGRQISIGCILPPSDSCRMATVEMVQGVECILPMDIETGNILYPCEYIFGSTTLPNTLGQTAEITYEPYVGGLQCFTTCLQGMGVSIGCTAKNDFEEILCLPCVREFIKSYDACGGVTLQIDEQLGVIYATFACGGNGIILPVLVYFDYRKCDNDLGDCDNCNFVPMFTGSSADLPSCEPSKTIDNEYNNITIIPNPASNIFKISNIEPSVIKSVKLYDVSGKDQKVITSNDGELMIGIAELSSGIYFVNILLTNGNQVVKKIVKI